MNHASGKDYDPSAWAKQRNERIKRASQVSVISYQAYQAVVLLYSVILKVAVHSPVQQCST